MTDRADRRRQLVPAKTELSDLAADAYAAAARTEASMAQAVEVIEPIRSLAARSSDGYDLLRAFDGGVLTSVGSSLLPIMTALRDRYQAHLTQTAGQTALRVHGERRTEEWLATFVDALCEFELTICLGLLDAADRANLSADWLPDLRRAVVAARRGEWLPLVPLLDRLLALDSWQDGDRGRLLALSALVELYHRGDRIRAYERAAEARRLGPELPEVIEATALVDLADGRREDAEELLKPLVKSRSSHDGIYTAYADCASADGEWELAEKRLLTGLQVQPASSDILIELVYLYCQPGFFELRRDRLSLITAQAGAVDPEASYGMDVAVAGALRQVNELPAAEEILTRLISEVPDRATAHLELARLQLEVDPSACRRTLDEAARLRPRSVEVAELYAQVAEVEDDLPTAVEWSRRAVEWSDGRSVWAYLNLAGRELRTGAESAAWDAALAALRRAPRDARMLDMLSDEFAARWRSGGADQVAAAYESAVAAGCPLTPADVQHGLGVVAANADDPEAAIDHLRAAIQLAPDQALHRRSLGRVLRDERRWEESLAAFEAAAELDHDASVRADDLSHTHNERGNAAVSAARFDAAVADYEAAIALVPAEPVFHSNLALALELTDRPGQRAMLLARAASALTEAQRLDPAASDYGVRLTRVEERLRRIRRFGELVEQPVLRKPIVVEVADDLVALLDPAQRGAEVFDQTIPAMRTALRLDPGFEFPALSLMGGDQDQHTYRIRLDGTQVASGSAHDGFDSVSAPRHVLVARGLPGDDLIEATDAVTGRACTWVRSTLESVELDELPRRTPVDIIFGHLASVLRQHADQYFTLDVASDWIREHAGSATGEVTEPSGGAEQSSRSAAAERTDVTSQERRQLATARALRGCLLRRMRLDTDLLRSIERALNASPPETTQNPLRWAAAAVAAVTGGTAEAAGPVGEPEPGASEQRSLPGWVESKVAAAGRLAPAEEHRLIVELLPDLERHKAVTLHTPSSSVAAYIGRVLSDAFAALPGSDIEVIGGAATTGAGFDGQELGLVEQSGARLVAGKGRVSPADRAASPTVERERA